MDPELQELADLIKNLTSFDKTRRIAAEAQLKDWARRSDLLLVGLARFLSYPCGPQFRRLCSEMLCRFPFKRLVASPEKRLWDAVQDTTRSSVRELLLVALNNGNEQRTHQKIIDTIVQIAKSDLADGVNCDMLLEHLYKCCQSPTTAHRESALQILSRVPELIYDQNVSLLKMVFLDNLTYAFSQKVRIEAMKVAITYIEHEEWETQKELGTLIPPMLDMLTPAIMAHDDEILAEILMTIDRFADNVPRLFRPVLSTVLTTMVNIVKDKALKDSTRQSALNLSLALIQSAPALARQLPSFASEIIPIVLEKMADFEDNDNWYTIDEFKEGAPEKPGEGPLPLDIIAQTLDSETVFSVVSKYIPEMQRSDVWQQRHAFLMAISLISEGCRGTMKPKLGNIIQMILPYLKDPHPRVRHAACNALGQMATDFSPYFQENFHQPFIINLVPVMGETNMPRLQSHAAAALVNFCEEASADILNPYLDDLFQPLMALVDASKGYVREQAICTITVVINAVQGKVLKRHLAIMPFLLDIITRSMDAKHLEFHCQLLECISFIAVAIGKEAFRPYLQDFIHHLIDAQPSVQEPGNTQTIYLLATWARMFKLMGQELSSHLPNVMSNLLWSARLTPELNVVNVDDTEEREMMEHGWEMVNINGQRICVLTSLMEEKYTAVKLLAVYARELGPRFQPYVTPVLELATSLLEFKFHSGIRNAAAALLPLLLQVALDANTPKLQLAVIWHLIFHKMMHTLANEDDLPFVAKVYMAFSEAVNILGNRCLQADDLEEFASVTKKHLETVLENLERLEQEKMDDAYDDSGDKKEDDAVDENEDLLDGISQAIQSMIKTHQSEFMPYFEPMLPLVERFAKHTNSTARRWTICLYDILIEFLGPTSYHYARYLVNTLIEGLQDPAPSVRQAAAYGVGVMAHFGGERYADVCAASLDSLFSLINTPNARDDEMVYVTDNAVAAVAKICKFNNSKVATDPVLSAWVNTLPILHDVEEVPMVYTYLLELMEMNHPSIIGPSDTNIPILVKIFAQVLASDILDTPLVARIVNSLKVILADIDDTRRRQLWDCIPQETRTALRNLASA